MKKALQINLNGMVFHIDEDAYEKLQDYLNALKRKFKNREEGEEIIQDIESRIAELFETKIKGYKQVITLDDVGHVISVLGQPEDFADEEEEAKKEDHKTGPSHEKRARRLYRDPDHALLAGICAGIAAYFKTDPVFIRILFIILLILSAFTLIVVYLVLWFIIPDAVTTAQKLEMRGEKVTVENIEKTIRQEYEKVKDNFKKFKKSKEYRRSREVANEITHGMGSLIKALVRIAGVIVGFAFVVLGIVLIITLMGFLVFKVAIFPGVFGWNIFPINEFLTVFIDAGNIQLFKIGLLLVVFIPLLSIIVGGVKLILGVRSKNKSFGIAGFILWFLGLIIVIAILFIEGQALTYQGEQVQTQTLTYPLNKTLYLDISDEMYERVHPGEKTYLYDHPFIFQMNTRERLFIRSRLDIEKSKDNTYTLVTEYYAHGNDRKDAEKNCRKVVYNHHLEDSILEFDPYFTIRENEKYRLQYIEVNLEVPVGARINISEDLDYILDDMDHSNEISRWDLYNKEVIMTEDGLAPVEE